MKHLEELLEKIRERINELDDGEGKAPPKYEGQYLEYLKAELTVLIKIAELKDKLDNNIK